MYPELSGIERLSHGFFPTGTTFGSDLVPLEITLYGWEIEAVAQLVSPLQYQK